VHGRRLRARLGHAGRGRGDQRARGHQRAHAARRILFRLRARVRDHVRHRLGARRPRPRRAARGAEPDRLLSSRHALGRGAERDRGDPDQPRGRLRADAQRAAGAGGAVDPERPALRACRGDAATAGALGAADVVLAVGTKLGHRSLEKLGVTLGAGQTLIHLDLDPSVIGRAFKAEIAVVGDARDGLERLVQALGPGPAARGWDRAWLAELRKDAGPRFTPELAEALTALRGALPDDAIVVNDQTGLTYWMEHRFSVYAPRTFLYPTGLAVLGYAVPAAIGAKLARPERAVVAVAGDGGFMFSVAELATAV